MSRSFSKLTCRFAMLLFICTSPRGEAQIFQPGNLVILRLGDPTQFLVNSGNTIYLDEYTRSGALMRSVTVPDNGSTALILSGTAATEGGLTRSLDGRELALIGYCTNRGSTLSGSLSSQTGASVPRGVATVDAFGNYNLLETSLLLYSGTNPRCVIGDGTNNFWTAGGDAGTYYLAPPVAPVTIQNTILNTRYIRVRNGNLYFTTRAGTDGLYTFSGGGLPNTSAGTSLVFATGTNSQPTGFDINRAFTVAYVADERPGNEGGIQKWVNIKGAWFLAYTLGTGTSSNAFGVTVDFSGSSPLVYATTTQAGLDRLICLEDTNSTSTPTIIATAALNQTFRGIDFAPDLRPIILYQPQSQAVVSGSDVELNVTVSSGYATSYQWQFRGTNLSGETGTSLLLPSVTLADQGNYEVVVSNQFGSINSADAFLTVETQLLPPAITNQPLPQQVTLGGTATFQVGASGTPPLSYQWRMNATNLPAQTDSTLVLKNLSPNAQGSYDVVISNAEGQAVSQPATLTVLTPPTSYIAYTAPGLIYSQNFDSIPNPGTESVNADNPVMIAANSYGVADPFDFAWPVIGNGVDATNGIGLGGLGLSNTAPGWYGWAAATPKLGASAGDQSTGGVISFGLTNNPSASMNRALGLLATSSTGGTAFGARCLNQTTNVLNQITLHFTGELWRQAAVQKVIAFGYWIDVAGTNGFSTNLTGTLSTLNVSFPPDASLTNPVPVDGNAAVNQQQLGLTNLPIVDWPPGGALWLVWQMHDFSGKGQGVAIDDFSFSVSSASVPVALTIQQVGNDVVISWPAITGSVLQSTSELGLSNAWTPVAALVLVTNGFNQVTLPPVGTSQYYRVKE